EKLRCQNRERAEPDERGNQAAHRAPVPPFEKIAKGQIAVGGGLAPHARTNRERQHQRANPRRSVPPPRAQAFGESKRGRSDSRARADIGRKERRENQTRTKPAAANEKIAGTRTTACPQPHGDKERGVGEEQREGQLLEIPSGGVAGEAGRGADG